MSQNSLRPFVLNDIMLVLLNLGEKELLNYSFEDFTQDQQEQIAISAASYLSLNRIHPLRAMIIALKTYKPSIFFRTLKFDVLNSHYSFLAKSKGCTQDPSFHTEDVFDHLMTCIDNFDIYYKSNKISIDKNLVISMKLALLFHDAGKPFVKSMK